MTTSALALPPTTLPPVVETASTAVAAHAKATVEARFLMALQRPRSWNDMRVKLLDACKRPGFAETALYQKPIGREKVTGPSIRFVEEALRSAGNVLAEALVVFDDADRRIVRVMVTDLEGNISYPQDIIIAKTVERRQTRPGQTIIGSRQNTRGETVYIIEASEDELITKQQALTSKSIRTSGLRLIPSDIVEEAIAQINATLRDADAKDPHAARKRLVDVFFAQGVGPNDLEAFLGHKIDQVSPAQLNQLRLIYQAIKEGETTWSVVMEERKATASVANGAKESGKTEGKGNSGLKSKLGATGAPPMSDEELDAKIAAGEVRAEKAGL